MARYLWRTDGTRLNYLRTKAGAGLNWLFFPGGPGMDSEYLSTLTELLPALEGHLWCVDLPENGTNTQNGAEYDYSKWSKAFLDTIKCFENPVIVVHSFAAMFALTHPALETLLKGCVILNSSPRNYLETMIAIAQQYQLPDLTENYLKLMSQRDSDSIKNLFLACSPYFFAEIMQSRGEKWLQTLSFDPRPYVWSQFKFMPTYDATWIPSNIPTLIVSGTRDYITPSILFSEDKRFQRPNIQQRVIEGAGHYAWLECPEQVATAFMEFQSVLKKV